jgi:hypothetical protein
MIGRELSDAPVGILEDALGRVPRVVASAYSDCGIDFGCQSLALMDLRV